MKIDTKAFRTVTIDEAEALQPGFIETNRPGSGHGYGLDLWDATILWDEANRRVIVQTLESPQGIRHFVWDGLGWSWLGEIPAGTRERDDVLANRILQMLMAEDYVITDELLVKPEARMGLLKRLRDVVRGDGSWTYFRPTFYEGDEERVLTFEEPIEG